MLDVWVTLIVFAFMRGPGVHTTPLYMGDDPARCEQVAEDFARKKPRIAVGNGDGEGRAAIRITPSQMQPGNAQVVAERIYEILAAERSPKPAQLLAASVDLSGHWDLSVHYFTSTSQHQLFLRQEGNWVRGTHISDFSTQEIVGVVEGNQLKLSSTMRRPGNGISFMFAGEISAAGMSGSIHLGEYLQAQFTAKRSDKEPGPVHILIPSGPPLAT